MSSFGRRLEGWARDHGMELVLCFKSGAAASAALGVATVQVLDDLTPTEVWGTSSGALVGSALSQGMDGAGVEQMVGSINRWKLAWDVRPIRKWRGGAWFDWHMVDSWMQSWLTVRRFADFGIPMHVMTSRQDPQHRRGWSRAIYSTRHTPDLEPRLALRASMAVSGVFTPVEIGGCPHIDGANTTSKTWKQIVEQAAGRRLLIVVVNAVFTPPPNRWQSWIDSAAQTYDQVFDLPGGHRVVVLNLEWGQRHPFDFRGTLQFLPMFRQVVKSELTTVCVALETAGRSVQMG